MTATLTLDLSSSPSGSTPTAASLEDHIPGLRSAYLQTSSQPEISSPPASSSQLARTSDFPQQFSSNYNEPKPTEPSSGLRTSLIVLSAVLFVTAIVVGWLVWRRYHQQRRKNNEGSGGTMQQDLFRPSPLHPKSTSRQSGVSGMTCQTPFPGKDWCMSLPAYSIDHHCQPDKNGKTSAPPKLSLGKAIPSKSSCLLEYPPTPPAKQTSKLPSSAPHPSSKTTPGCSSGYGGAAAHTTIAPSRPSETHMDGQSRFV